MRTKKTVRAKHRLITHDQGLGYFTTLFKSVEIISRRIKLKEY